MPETGGNEKKQRQGGITKGVRVPNQAAQRLGLPVKGKQFEMLFPVLTIILDSAAAVSADSINSDDRMKARQAKFGGAVTTSAPTVVYVSFAFE